MVFTVLVSPVGTGLRQVQTKLKALPDVAVCDVEDTMLEDPDLQSLTRLDQEHPLNIRRLLARHTKADVMDRWSAALGESVARLERSGLPHKVLALHPSLFGPRRYEHFSTLGHLARAAVIPTGSQVVVLIDDIYDMWTRLSRESRDLFNQEGWLNRRAEAQEIEYLFDSTRPIDDPSFDVTSDDAAIARDHLVWSSSVTILSQLLSWRHLDMIGAESLADALGGRLTTLGVKHPFELLRLVVTAQANRTVYLSHPISRPRRAFARTGVWPDVVADSNALAARLANRGTVLICPTAVDEYRLAVPGDLNPWQAYQRDLALRTRWPTLANSSGSIAMDEPSSLLRQIEAEAASIDSPARRVYAKMLDDLIFAEVPFRDHFLVQHSDSFLVYRPHYKEGRFSSGVRSEINHWETSAESGQLDRQALFVHTASDIEAWLLGAQDNLPQQVRGAARDVMRAGGHTDHQIDALLNDGPSAAGMLDSEPFEDLTRDQALRVVLDRAVRTVFFRGLTLLKEQFFLRGSLRPLAPVMVLQGLSPSEDEVDRMSQILNRNPAAIDLCLTAFDRWIEDYLGSDLSGWASDQLGAARP